MFFCGKKQQYLTGKRVLKKCIGINLKKRGRICPSLEARDEETGYGFSLSLPYRFPQQGDLSAESRRAPRSTDADLPRETPRDGLQTIQLRKTSRDDWREQARANRYHH